MKNPDHGYTRNQSFVLALRDLSDAELDALGAQIAKRPPGERGDMRRVLGEKKRRYAVARRNRGQ